MAAQKFSELGTLTGVKETDKVLGRGAYATVLELDFMGLKVAGKKFNEKDLVGEDVMSRFSDAHYLLCKSSHPNIVQFLGLFSPQDQQLPILVMEKLPINLTRCIAKCGVLPDGISYSILKGVSLGLHFLHSQVSPVIHRNISSNNVLLTSNMTAKLADLGTENILNLNLLRVSLTPSVHAYMPPEVLVSTPQYSTSTDMFSFGVLMIHIFCGELPQPDIGQTRIEDGKPKVNTEAQRRNKYLQKIQHEHPLKNLILTCIDNVPEKRGHSSDIINHDVFTQQLTTSFSDQLVQLSNSIANSQSMMREKDKEISHLQDEADSQDVRIKQLDEQISDLERKANIVKQMRENIDALSQDMEECSQVHASEREALIEENTKLVGVFENLVNIKERVEQIIVTKPSKVTSSVCSKYTIITSVIVMVILLAAVILGMHFLESHKCNDQIKSLNKTFVQHPSQSGDQTQKLYQRSLEMTISWEILADLPVEMSEGQSTVINGAVYFGGGSVSDEKKRYLIYKYNPSANEWTSLPPLPVRSFGVGQMSGKLIAIGGVKVNNKETNEIFTYEEDSNRWVQTIPSMPTSRFSPGVFSHQSLLVVGGSRSSGHVVEIFKSNTLLWYTTDDDPVPVKCYGLSTVIINGASCILGGSMNRSRSNQAYYASIENLLQSARSASQKSSTGNSTKKQSTWKKLPNTPTYQPAAAVLAGNLLAIGGSESKDGGLDRKEVYMYSPFTKTWIHISDLPSPRSLTSAAILSSTEILVIGGSFSNDRVRSVYKGTII